MTPTTLGAGEAVTMEKAWTGGSSTDAKTSSTLPPSVTSLQDKRCAPHRDAIWCAPLFGLGLNNQGLKRGMSHPVQTDDARELIKARKP